MEATCGYCGEAGVTPVACGDHGYCEGCAQVPCDWCSRKGAAPSPSSPDCPVCHEVWLLEATGDFICAGCVQEALDEGTLWYCADHARCYVKMAPCEGLPDGADDHPGCNVTGDRAVVAARLRSRGGWDVPDPPQAWPAASCGLPPLGGSRTAPEHDLVTTVMSRTTTPGLSYRTTELLRTVRIARALSGSPDPLPGDHAIVSAGSQGTWSAL